MGLGVLHAEPSSNTTSTNEIRIQELQGTVEVSPAGAQTWVLTQTNQVLRTFDRMRTGPNSRVALRWSDRSVVSFGASTEIEVLPPENAKAQPGLRLARGILSFFHRDEPGRIRVLTRGAVAGVEGTEFVLFVDDTDRSVLSVIDGRVRFGNDRDTIVLTNGQQAVVEAGRAPFQTAGFIANNLLQWCFYYPAVLDPDELTFSTEAGQALGGSLEAYRSGDVLQALSKFPAGRRLETDVEKVYHAALLLSVGEVGQAQPVLDSVAAAGASSREGRLASALRLLIQAVKRQPGALAVSTPELATEFLADSYYQQSRAMAGVSLSLALRQAKAASARSPGLGYAWARIAELEFSFGRTSDALQGLERSLAISPRNAQALALKGFLLAADNQSAEAISWFNRSLDADSALGNAWLGRGLCRIRLGDEKGGQEDLMFAAALEPQRAELRTYLGKAYDEVGDEARAMRELELARDLDPADPTPWLYSALLRQQHNRINDAIRDLEKSQRLNDNQSVYRSQLLLDEDRAVRAANLAAIYQDAGMFEVALREAARSVNYDYANYSAHLFLANSYHALQDPNLFTLRYETPARSEYLLAELLSPVSAGTLSPAVSQREYTRLFERDGVGAVSQTDYLSRGAWTQSGAQYGTLGNFGYAVGAFYHSDRGQRPNKDTEQVQVDLALKYAVTPQDTLLFRISQFESESGDVLPYYDPGMANTNSRVYEEQRPVVGLGYHREWGPGVHTLVYLTRLHSLARATNATAPLIIAFRPDVDPENRPGVTALTGVIGTAVHELFEGELEIYSGELQQIWQTENHNTIFGARAQWGKLETKVLQDRPWSLAPLFPDPPQPIANQDFSSEFKRFSVYGYHQWQVADTLQLIGGITYDRIIFPQNFRNPPISEKDETREAVLPKAGAIWTPTDGTAVRFAYTRSLAGASLDQSYQLEPPQVAGFVQSYRSLIPDSVAGRNAGARFESFGLSIEQKFRTGTYLGITGELLYSQVHRTVGSFDVLPDRYEFAIPSGLRQNLDYNEQSLLFTANQLLGRDWALGAIYRVSRAELNDDFVDVPFSGLMLTDFEPRHEREAVLHQVKLLAVYNHPCGFFAQQEAIWYSQSNSGYSPELPGDHFWHLNAYIGYRLPRRHAEIALGLLNLTDEDYRLNPLNIYSDLPRQRTLAMSFRWNF